MVLWCPAGAAVAVGMGFSRVLDERECHSPLAGVVVGSWGAGTDARRPGRRHGGDRRHLASYQEILLSTRATAPPLLLFLSSILHKPSHPSIRDFGKAILP